MMDHDIDVVLRPARAGDGKSVFELTQSSVAGLAKNHYSDDQIAGWMGNRTPDYYEDLISHGCMVVAEQGQRLIGFVDSVAGEVTRLFISPEAAGKGLGARLLEIGIANARQGHEGRVKLEATLNAERFYRRHGFERVDRGVFSHGLGGDPIEIVHMIL